MRKYILVILIFGFLAQPTEAQRLMNRGHAPPPDWVTLAHNMPFDQALQVIQTFSKRPIIYSQHITEPIGLNIDRQPWPWALVEIARNHGLYVVEKRDYYELLPDQNHSGSPAHTPTPEATIDSREVNISAVFFQADRKAIRELGIDWTTLSQGRVQVQSSLKGGERVSDNIFSLEAHSQITDKLSISALLKMFESKNVGEVVANPQIKVQNGKKGYIQVGSDFSVTTSDFAGNAITQFFSTGTILTVTPKILSENKIEFVDLEVEAERSSLVDPVRNLISKTVARTSALLRDGEQTAIGGLYGQEVSQSRTGIPLLKDMPAWFFGLRYLFGHNAKQVTKTELVVLLKVTIVPSVRQRAEASQHPTTSSIMHERQKKFEALIEQFKHTHSVPDSTR